MIKLIAMDFDNTLISYDYGKEKINRRLREFLENYIECGCHAAIVSGRSKWEFQETFLSRGEIWGGNFPDYIISREAYIYKIVKGEYYEFNKYNSVVSKKINNTIRTVATHIGLLLKKLEEANIIIEKWFIYSDFAVEIHVGNKNRDKAMSILSSVLEKLGINEVAVHRNANMVTIYDKSAGKGNTLMALTESLGILPSEVLAIGDSFNDISMIDGKIGFLGACVGNSENGVKEIVKRGGGIIGHNAASDSIMDIIDIAAQQNFISL